LFIALVVLVATRAIDPFDDAVRHWFWPDAEWGESQQLADRVANVLNPKLLALIAIAFAAVLSLRSRSAVPLLVVVAVVCLAGGLEIAVKWLMPRIAMDDPHTRFAGSFPSGHMTAAVGFLGAAVYCVPRGWRWIGWSLVAVFAAVMALCLMAAALHYVSDVVGGALLAVCVLAAVATALASLERVKKRRNCADDRLGIKL
jgi:membrane-associated phospholipid phosphatase